MAASYPQAARAAGVPTGRALIACVVQASGKLSSCSVESEQPAGMGFGPSALLMTSAFALTPWTEDGLPLDGARIRVPIRFVDADVPEPAGAATGATGG
jgi:protein TonB